MPRLSAEQHIASLEAQIAALKAKAAAEKVRKDPAHKTIAKAVKFVDRAASETRDPAMRASLEEVRSMLSACLQLDRKPAARGAAPIRPSRSGTGVDRDTLLAYVRSSPGARGEQIAQALGTDVKTMRPVMKELIAEDKIRTVGQRRGMTYHPV